MKLSHCAALVVVAIMGMPSTSFAQPQQCTDENGNAFGEASTRGPLDIKLDDNRSDFQRLGGELCPCSYVKADCKLGNPVFVQDDFNSVPWTTSGGPGDHCSTVVINGETAASNDFYPVINVQQDYEICNYNSRNEVRLSPESTGKRVWTRFYHPTNTGQVDVKTTPYNGQTLGAKQCFTDNSSAALSSFNVKSFMEVYLQGMQYTVPGGSAVSEGFCYAYTFHRIDLNVFYPSLGECKMRTELECKLEDRDIGCAEYIEAKKYSCDKFMAVFTAKGCNDNNRVVQIQKGSSNYKINTYNRDANDKLIRIKEKFPDQLSANECATFNTTKEVDPCQSNFWQVNVEGKEFIQNEPNGWYFKDKDCISYSYATLPLAVQTPTVTPSPTPDNFNQPGGVGSDIPTVSHSPNYVPSRPSPTRPTKRPSPTGPTRPTKKDETPAPTTKSNGKAGKAKKTTTDGEWEYNVRRRRRG